VLCGVLWYLWLCFAISSLLQVCGSRYVLTSCNYCCVAQAGVTAVEFAAQLGSSKNIQALLQRAHPAGASASVAVSDRRDAANEQAQSKIESAGHIPSVAAARVGADGSISGTATAGADSSSHTAADPSAKSGTDFSLVGDSIRYDRDSTQWRCRTQPAAGSEGSWEEVLSCRSSLDGQEVQAYVSYRDSASSDRGEAAATRNTVAAEEAVGSGTEGGEGDELRFSVGSNPSSQHSASASASEDRRGHKHRASGAANHRDKNRAAKRQKVKELRAQRRRERAASCGSQSDLGEMDQCTPQAGQHDICNGAYDSTQPPVREQAEAALYHLRAQYQQKLQAVSARYEARIAALQAQLRSTQGTSETDPHQCLQQEEQLVPGAGEGELNSSVDWDQEIHFQPDFPNTSPGKRSPRSGTPAGLGRSPRHRKQRRPSSPVADTMSSPAVESAAPMQDGAGLGAVDEVPVLDRHSGVGQVAGDVCDRPVVQAPGKLLHCILLNP
jgi:hypothetical protein